MNIHFKSFLMQCLKKKITSNKYLLVFQVLANFDQFEWLVVTVSLEADFRIYQKERILWMKAVSAWSLHIK